MDRGLLEDLGLTVREHDGVAEAELPLITGQAVNPLTRQFLSAIRFTVIGERLIPIDPPEFVGMAPVHVGKISRDTNLEEVMVKALNDHCLALTRRSTELGQLGIKVKVDPATLLLSATFAHHEYTFVVGSDRWGNFKLVKARRGSADLFVPGTQAFELSDFKAREALGEYLSALVADLAGAPSEELLPFEHAPEDKTPTPVLAAEPLFLRDVVEAFGGQVRFPPRSAIEVVAELKVRSQSYRFAVARVVGSTFRGLLAGPEGKVWADKFELDQFPGLKALVATQLGVSQNEVEVIG